MQDRSGRLLANVSNTDLKLKTKEYFVAIEFNLNISSNHRRVKFSADNIPEHYWWKRDNLQTSICVRNVALLTFVTDKDVQRTVRFIIDYSFKRKIVIICFM